MTQEAPHINEPMSDMVDMAFKAGEQFSQILEQITSRSTSEDDPAATVMNDFNDAFSEFANKLMENPSLIVNQQMALMQDQMKLWQQTALKFAGQEATPIIEPESHDRRFKDEEWSSNIIYDYLKQFYLLQSKAANDMLSLIHI